MKLFCNAGLMKDDHSPLSSFQPELDGQFDSNLPSNSPLMRSRIWNGIFSGLKKRQAPLMRIRMVGTKETRTVVSDRPDLEAFNSTDQNLGTQAVSNVEVMNEPRIIYQINELTQKTVHDYLPKVERYEVLVSAEPEMLESSGSRTQDDQNPPATHSEWNSTEFAGLSEVLLQALLKLDGFDIDSEWADARLARKEGVRAVQKLLDRLDQVKAAKDLQR